MAGPRAVGEQTLKLARRSLGKRGFVEASLVADWAAIVGAGIGAGTRPLRISFPKGERAGGVLHIKVDGGATALELQHLEGLVVSRINRHFGYGAIARLSLHQGPLGKAPPRAHPAAPTLTPDQTRHLDAQLAGVDDPELRQALARLGRYLAGSR